MNKTNIIKLGICMFSIAFGSNAIATENQPHLASLLGDKSASKETKLTDTQLADKVRDEFVKEKLFGKDKFADMGIHVTAKNGVVSLTGRVSSQEDIDKAVKITRSVDQVKNVKSQIDIRQDKKPSTKK